ncbi:MAG: DEAD/DEAH box helicase family protein [Ruminococcus sp.]|nr:DEAD/DEAH box helicase family protein [Ruminococcus sp.]
MELKNYQNAVMKDLTSYISILNKENDLIKAWKRYWNEKDISVGVGGVPKYNNSIKGVPHVCMKVPTGGGKTFMACASVRKIFDGLQRKYNKLVIWLVPSDPILVQTVKNLTNVNHPYRHRLDTDFAGCVEVYTKEMLLNGQNFSPDAVREQLTVCILSYQSLRIDDRKKEGRNAYKENGNLLKFAEYFGNDMDLLENTPDTALIQVLRNLNPVVIVDESHNAGSDLSIEMLNNLNPSFVLDLTATPRKNSNIISYVDTRELKKENMVKLPVIVYNRTSRNSVIDDAIHLRNVLEKQAIAEQRIYIRPIVLFQAQPKNNNDSETFDKVKKILIEKGIPEEQIAIKTSKIDDISQFNLMSENCPIRYIITVNALKEGWDCPFAYILASLANKTSKIDVEQIVGRILRQPNAKKNKSALLNTSFVFTCSNDFRNTLENIVKGLNDAGFSRKDYRVGEEELPLFAQNEPVEESIQQEFSEPAEQDSFDDIDTSVISAAPVSTTTEIPENISIMISQAQQQSERYEQEAEENDNSGFLGGELGDMIKQYHIQPQYEEQVKKLRIPQFFMKSTPDLFGGDTVFLDKNSLLEGFNLSEQDANINFTLSSGEMYTVDIQSQGDAVPKYKKVSKTESEYINGLLARSAPEDKIKKCTEYICHDINQNNAFATPEVDEYVNRIVSNMTEDELAVIETSFTTYAMKIKEKIKELQEVYMEKQFYKWLDSGKIVCQEEYSFPIVITPSTSNDSVPLSLYDAEYDKLNNEEKNIRDILAGTNSVEWWHRIIEKKGFCINAFINHYPDFIVKMKSGRIVVVEYKGGDRDNSDSKTKLKLGRQWASYAGTEYRYFMVFDSNPIEDAYTLDDFADMLKNI